MPRPPDHPDPGRIAAHAERRLPSAEAARMDEHLAACSECYDTFAETVRFALDEEAQEVPERRAKPEVPLFYQRPAFRLAAVLAVATFGLFMAQNLWMRRAIEEVRQRQAGRVGLVAELVQAMGTTRFVEPRLTGGFEHGRLVVLRSGDRPQGLDAYSPAVLAAIAHIREKAQGDSSPTALGALAVTYLVSGDVDKAVRALESATAQDPKNPRLQSDLSAAYLVRATRLDEPADLPRALEAAETAIESKDAPAEAWFNRALVLEQLHLVDSAKKAWQEYLQHDSTSEWADEARKRIEELPPAQKSTLEEDRARARAATAEGQSAIDRLADEAPAVLSDYFLAELLPAWADAQLTGHPSASALRIQAQQIGDALLRATGDALPRDAALALEQAPSTPGRDPPLRLQALGYKALDEGQRSQDRQQPACPAFRNARHLLESGGSPYAAWARERVVVACPVPTHQRVQLSELSRLEETARQRQYGLLLARSLWMQALTRSDAGDFDRSLRLYRQARDVYRTLRDPEGEASVVLRLAFVLDSSGDGRAAWRERLRALSLFDTMTQPARREEVLFLVAVACWQDHLARSAVTTLTEMANVTRRRNGGDRLALALVWRSDVLHVLGRDEQAIADLAEARSTLSRSESVAYADSVEASAAATEGRVLARSRPEVALSGTRRAIDYFARVIPAFVPALRVQEARILRARGSVDEAEAALEASIRQLEAQQALLSDVRQQALFFDYAATTPFDEMVSLQLDARGDPARALQYVERSRGRLLAQSLAQANARRAGSRLDTRLASSTPEASGARLPAGVALVYYVRLPDRLVAWVVDRDGEECLRLSVPPDELEHRIAGYSFAIESGAAAVALRDQSARLFDQLVRPLLAALAGHDSVALVPDGFLRGLSFASLWNRETKRYLVEDFRLVLTPNRSVLLQASAAAARAHRSGAVRVLAVGNPRLAPGSGLPSLPGSEAEATEIASLYSDSDLLLAAAATKRAFRASLARSDVVHFAGHALQGDAPGSGRLLLAADPSTGVEGVLRPDEIEASDLGRARLVVLAGCRTATGERSRLQGATGVVRPFLAGGVPMVVASLWDVDDAASRTFFLELHRQFRASGDAAAAVREAQLVLLRSGDPHLAHPSHWAGFVSFGGLLPAPPERRPVQPTL